LRSERSGDDLGRSRNLIALTSRFVASYAHTLALLARITSSEALISTRQQAYRLPR
jgi:hypothetical protein